MGTIIGIPSCAIRLLCHVPVGMVSVVGTRLYHAADELDQGIFDAILHGRSFFRGIEILARAGTATFVWNIIQWLGSGFWHRYVLAAVGVIDLALAGTLLTGIVFQSRFLPHSYSECRDAANWRNGSDGWSFFAVSAGGTEDADTACRRFVRIWVLAIVIVTLYIICGTVNIVLGIGEKYILPPEPGKPQQAISSHPPQPKQQSRITPHPDIYFHLWIIGTVMVFSLYAMSATRFGFRCIIKLITSLYHKHASVPTTSEADAQHHCSSTSTSEEYVNSKCFICTARICTKCQHSVHVPEKTITLVHLHQCHQWCSQCMFFKSRDFLGLGQYLGTVTNQHHSPGGTRLVCGPCHDKTMEEKTDLLEARQRMEIRRLARLPLLCRACEAPLRSTGPRWWVVPGTRKECKHASHPGWVS